MNILLFVLLITLTKSCCEFQLKPLNIFTESVGFNFFTSNRVVGGSEIVPHSYPFVVYLSIDEMYMCGGTIICNKTIVTAAHCADVANTIEVIAGVHDRTQNEPSQQKIRSTNFTIHELWNRKRLINDIALIHLEKELVFNDYVQNVVLDDGECLSHELDNTNGTVVGWGRLSDDGKDTSPVLQEVTNTILSNQKCMLSFSKVTEKNICLSGTSGKGACLGDSGGPLLGIRPSKDKRAEVGIVSYGNEKCQKGYPIVFTRVSCYKNWIKRHSNC